MIHGIDGVTICLEILGGSYYSTFGSHFGFANACHVVCVWPTALKLGCITNFDMLFLRFICLVDLIKFML